MRWPPPSTRTTGQILVHDSTNLTFLPSSSVCIAQSPEETDIFSHPNISLPLPTFPSYVQVAEKPETHAKLMLNHMLRHTHTHTNISPIYFIVSWYLYRKRSNRQVRYYLPWHLTYMYSHTTRIGTYDNSIHFLPIHDFWEHHAHVSVVSQVVFTLYPFEFLFVLLLNKKCHCTISWNAFPLIYRHLLWLELMSLNKRKNFYLIKHLIVISHLNFNNLPQWPLMEFVQIFYFLPILWNLFLGVKIYI